VSKIWLGEGGQPFFEVGSCTLLALAWLLREAHNTSSKDSKKGETTRYRVALVAPLISDQLQKYNHKPSFLIEFCLATSSGTFEPIVRKKLGISVICASQARCAFLLHSAHAIVANCLETYCPSEQLDE
jgi:hypothetical protein